MENRVIIRVCDECGKEVSAKDVHYTRGKEHPHSGWFKVSMTYSSIDPEALNKMLVYKYDFCCVTHLKKFHY